MAARSLLRPMRRRVRTGPLIALRSIGAGLMLPPAGRDAGAPTATPAATPPAAAATSGASARC